MRNFIKQLLSDLNLNLHTTLSNSTIEFVAGIADAVIKAVVLLIIWKILQSVIARVYKKAETAATDSNERLRQLLPYGRAVVNVLFAIAGLLFFFSDGVAAGLQAVLTGSGVAAIALGIACQDTIGNLFAGIVLVITRPFKVGDTIRYVDADIAGKVEAVTFRHTVVRTFENKQLIIPNSVLSKSVVENYTGGDESICLMLDFSAEYGSDYRRQIEIIREAAETVENISDVRAHVEKLGDSAVILRLRAHIPALSYSIQMKNDIYLAVSDAYSENGFSFAYPHLSLDK